MAAFFRMVRMGVACLLLLIFVAILYPTTQAEDWRFPFVIFLPAGVVGALMLRGVLRERKRLARDDADAREVAALRLAVAEGGTLTATQVATRLGWPVQTALATLRALEDGGRIASRFTVDAVLLFEFRELIHHAARQAESIAAPEPPAVPSAAERAEPARSGEG